MTSKYRMTQLDNAYWQQREARARFDNAKTKSARREAAEDLEFWGSKVAFLSNPKIVG